MFGNLLSEVMKKYRIKGKEISIQTGLTEGFISDIRKGKSLPKKDNLQKILENIPITINEKEELIECWEKENSPNSFIERYEKLKENFDILNNFFLQNNMGDCKEFILKLEKENFDLKKEINELKLYKEFFKLLHDDDLKYLTNRISFINQNFNFENLFKKKFFNNK